MEGKERKEKWRDKMSDCTDVRYSGLACHVTPDSLPLTRLGHI